MPVSQHAVDELRREGEELGFDGVDHVLRSLAESLGYLIYQLRAVGADEDEIADDIELLVRATELPPDAIREARDVLARLRYPNVIIKRLTMVARKAKPTPPRRWANRKIGAASASPAPLRSTNEAELALNMLRPRRRGGR